ncbi:MAG: DUF2617 family protein [Planctomycetes bacterium]|nr:DUF2617 family protein [Planctomycetota bacterium]MBL7106412.1 DUF2617 family protein [Phycisphaerae bacterium]
MESPQANVAVEELTFNLFQRSLHPELFNIYSKRHFKTDKYEVAIWITGCRHVVSVVSGDSCLSEVISTPEQLLPQRGLVEKFKFSGPRSHKCTLSRGLSYMTNFQVEKVSKNIYKQTFADMQNFAKNRGMFVKFPDLSNNGLIPFCYVDFEARKSELHVHTFGAYPEQSTIIKTQSMFEVH